MPQLQSPMFPDGLTSLIQDLAFQREEGKVVYFHGLPPVFRRYGGVARLFPDSP